MLYGVPKRCGAANAPASAWPQFPQPRPKQPKRRRRPGGRDVDKSMNPLEVIVRPLVTEKSTALSGANKYIFEVDVRANKPQIKDAVEKAFNVTVTGVN